MPTIEDQDALPDFSLALAAAKVSYFERVVLFKGRGTIWLDPNLERHTAARMFATVNATTVVRNYTLSNVVLDADSLFIFKDSRTIRETDYFVPPGKGEPKINSSALVQLDDEEDIIVGYNNAHLGYQHWLTQCVPAIDWSLRQTRSRKVRLLLPALKPWQEVFLSLLGYSVIPRMAPEQGCQYALPSAEYCDFLSGATSFGVCKSVLETAVRISDRVPMVPSPHKVLYVPCANPYYGSIANEAEVVDLLQRRGVFILDHNKFSTPERINLFRQAEVVIGPLGQGLTDILFCRPGTLLWEWMPAHHQNSSFNGLAQTAELDYWANLFESPGETSARRPWNVDLATVARRLSEISNRLALRDAVPTSLLPAERSSQPISCMPLDELLVAFESLGDNCEFGLVQRHGGAEPLGLLRFAGIYLPIEVRLERIIAALGRKFEGLGSPETINVVLAGEPGRREFLVRESAYNLMYHTFIQEGQIEADELRTRESKRLQFLRRKLLEDLEAAEKIWVWKSSPTSEPDQVYVLLHILRSFGPNMLLWVVEGDDTHPPGTIEQLEPDFIKGYIERFAPYDSAADIRPTSWFEVCQRTYNLRYPDRVANEAEAATDVGDPSPSVLSAFEVLSRNPAIIRTDFVTQRTIKTSVLGRLWKWLRQRGF